MKTLLGVCQKSRESSFSEVMDSFVLVAYASLAASRTLLLSELYFRIRRFVLLVQMKISMSYGSSKSCWKPWRWKRFDLIYLMRDIYINSSLNPLTKFTSSSRSTEFKDILSWNISQMIPRTVRISMRIVICYAMKGGILFWVYWKINGNWDNSMNRISNGRKAIAEQILVSDERNKSKRSGLWESQSGIQVGKLTIWVRSFEIWEKL